MTTADAPPIEQGLQIELIDHAGRITIQVHGDVTADTAPLLHSALASALARSVGTVEVDLTAATSLAIAGLTMLLAAQSKLIAAGGGLRLVGASGCVAQLLSAVDCPLT